MTIRQDFVYNRSYTGQVKGLILDWSGTTADAYVLAPAVVFVQVFQNTVSKSRCPRLVDQWACVKIFISKQ